MFRVLPLVTVIDQSVLVCHGGVSDITDLEYINNIPRHKVSEMEPSGPSKQPISTLYLGQVTGYEPIRDQDFLVTLY